MTRSIPLLVHGSEDGHDSPLFVSRLLLGLVPDSVIEILGTYVEEAVAIVNDGTVDEDWTLIVIQSFEDSRILPVGTLVRATETLSRGADSREFEP